MSPMPAVEEQAIKVATLRLRFEMLGAANTPSKSDDRITAIARFEIAAAELEAARHELRRLCSEHGESAP